MQYSGTDAIDVLSKKIDKTDPAASSHWQKLHKGFKYNDGVLSGMQGFGGSQSPFTGIKKKLHYLFQKRYRNMGRQYDKFKFIDLKGAEGAAFTNTIYGNNWKAAKAKMPADEFAAFQKVLLK